MKKNLSFLVFIHALVLLLSIGTVSAQWTTSGPEGANIKCMTRSASTIYAVTGMYGYAIYKSTDNGDSWSYINSTTLPSDIRDIALMGNSLFLGTISGVYRSDDDGVTWVNKSGGFPAGISPYIVFMEVSGTTIFAAPQVSSPLVLLRSTDNGETWTNQTTGLTCGGINAIVAHEGAIFTGGGSNKKGVFRSTNNGDSWQQVITGMAYWFQNGWVQGYYPNVYSLGFSGTDLYVGSNNSQGIWKSSDNGANWVLTNTSTRSNQWYYSIKGDGSVVYAASLANGMLTSGDNGANWNVANNGIDIYYSMKNILVSENSVFTGTKGGIYKSTNQGSNWTNSNNGINGYEIPYYGAMTSTGSALFVSTTFGGGIFRSTDGGNSWSQVNNGLPVNQGNYGDYGIYTDSINLFSGGLMSSNNGDNWGPHNSPGGTGYESTGAPWIKHNTFLFSVKSNIDPGVYRSADNGGTWEMVVNGIDPSATVYASIFTDGNTLYLGTDYGYYYSSDNGNNWNTGFFPDYNQWSFNMASFFSGGSFNLLGLRGGGGQQGIYRTIDNGVNWVLVSDLLVHKFAVGDNKIWASGTYLDNETQTNLPAIYLSQDNGQTWNNISQGLIVNTASLSADGPNVYMSASNPDNIYCSIDNGNNWTNISDGLIANIEATSLNIFNGKLFAGTLGHSLWQRNLSDFVAPAQPDQIVGSETPCIGSSQIYSVTNVSGVTYSWQFPSGWIITAGNGTHSVTVTVGSTGGVIAVTPSNGFGTGPSQFLVVSPAQTVEATVSIAADQTSVCEGTSVLFTATPVNGGDTPVYLWYVNGIESGENNPVFTYIPVNNDIVSLQLTSSIGCVTNNPVQSNTIQIVVTNPTDAVSATINVDQSNICEGSLVTFTATPLNGGETPVYQWYVNGEATGTNSPVFAYVPVDNDVVYVLVTSSLSCVMNNPAQSDPITLQVITAIDVMASITVEQNDLCEGSEMTFFATTSGGGTEPSYDWQINGTSAGVNAESFSFVPENGDAISLVFTSSEWCTAQNPITSNTLVAIVNALPEVSWNYTDPTTVCIEDWGPITLTGGLPEGGIYSGDGVSGNIFDQAVAGVGNHVISYTFTDANNCSALAQIEFMVDACLGITESASTLYVYPNPATDLITIKISGNQSLLNISVFNVMGIPVFENMDPKASESFTIPVQNLPAGNYIIKIITEYETLVKPVIIK